MTLRRPCAQPRCPALVPLRARHCPRHAKEAQRHDRQRRGSSSERKYDTRWQKRRKEIVARDPICRTCKIKPTTDIDHDPPWQGRHQHPADAPDDELFGRCHECHSRKTRGEMNR